MDKLDNALRFNREALNLRAQRQEVLSANIANADTPNYKARDFDFGSKLNEVVARGRATESLGMRTTSSRHIAAQAPSSFGQDLMYSVPAQSSIDGNTVEMDSERVNFADNALRYESNLTVMGAKIKTLMSAVQQ